MKNIAGLMKQASQMQAKMAEMQAKVEALEVEGQSGAGMVRVTLGGKGELRRVKLDPKLADPAELEMLEDLLVSAHTDAKKKLDALMAEEMSRVTGGMELPAGPETPVLMRATSSPVHRSPNRISATGLRPRFGHSQTSLTCWLTDGRPDRFLDPGDRI